MTGDAMTAKTLPLAVITSLFVASAAWAVPSQLAHQGRLLDVEGAALTGEHSLTFALFDAATEGADVWSETITVNIVGGFYSVVLGADEGANPLDDLVLGNPPLWLELTVDDGEPLLPRHELLSVPYAVLAGTATNLEGGYVDATEVAVDGTTVIDAAGNWIGPTPPVGWGDLTGIPAGLEDGVDADTLAGLSCVDGGVAKFDLGSGLWACGIDSVLGPSEVLAFVDGAMLDLGIGSTVSGVTIATVAELDWSLLSSVPVGFLDGDDADSLAALSCADGARPRWDLGSGLWACDAVSWSELQGIPSDLSDGDADTLGGVGACADGGVAKFDLGTGLWTCGTDAVLTSGDVLGFVGGSALALGAGSSMGGSTLATLSSLTWGNLGGVPADLADGDADMLAALSCTDGGVAKFNLGTGLWACGTDLMRTSSEVLGFVDGAMLDLGIGSTANGVTIATLADLTWGSLSGVPGGFADGLDADSLATLGLICAGGDRPSWDAMLSDWVCTPEQVGLNRLNTSAATSGQVLTFDGSNVGWEDPAAPTNSPCTLGVLDEALGGALVNCGATSLVLRSWMRLTQASAGAQHTCGIDAGGSLRCWGANTFGQSTPPTGTFSQIDADGGAGTNCAIDTGGAVQCWGFDNAGQTTPPSGTFSQVSVGTQHICGIDSTDSVQCWGNGASGAATPPAGTFIQVSAGSSFTCGIRQTVGTLVCWGDNGLSQSTPPAGTFTQVGAGNNHACAINSSGSVQCWGANSYGESSPPSGAFTQISVGGYHACGLDGGGSVQCWGADWEGQSTPLPGSYTQITAGSQHTCGRLQTLGTVACWGLDSSGQSTAP